MQKESVACSNAVCFWQQCCLGTQQRQHCNGNIGKLTTPLCCLQEASLMLGLRHPNIVNIMGFCSSPAAIITGTLQGRQCRAACVAVAPAGWSMPVARPCQLSESSPLSTSLRLCRVLQPWLAACTAEGSQHQSRCGSTTDVVTPTVHGVWGCWRSLYALSHAAN